MTSWNKGGSENEPDVLQSLQAPTPAPKVNVAPDSQRYGKKREVFILVKKDTGWQASSPKSLARRISEAPSPVSCSYSEEHGLSRTSSVPQCLEQRVQASSCNLPTLGGRGGGGCGNIVKPVVLRTVTKLVQQRQLPTPQTAPKETCSACLWLCLVVGAQAVRQSSQRALTDLGKGKSGGEGEFQHSITLLC